MERNHENGNALRNYIALGKKQEIKLNTPAIRDPVMIGTEKTK